MDAVRVSKAFMVLLSPHDATTQKTDADIVAAERTSNLVSTNGKLQETKLSQMCTYIGGTERKLLD